MKKALIAVFMVSAFTLAGAQDYNSQDYIWLQEGYQNGVGVNNGDTTRGEVRDIILQTSIQEPFLGNRYHQGIYAEDYWSGNRYEKGIYDVKRQDYNQYSGKYEGNVSRMNADGIDNRATNLLKSRTYYDTQYQPLSDNALIYQNIDRPVRRTQTTTVVTPVYNDLRVDGDRFSIDRLQQYNSRHIPEYNRTHPNAAEKRQEEANWRAQQRRENTQRTATTTNRTDVRRDVNRSNMTNTNNRMQDNNVRHIEYRETYQYIDNDNDNNVRRTYNNSVRENENVINNRYNNNRNTNSYQNIQNNRYDFDNDNTVRTYERRVIETDNGTIRYDDRLDIPVNTWR